MKKYLILLFVAAAAVFQSCDNNDDLWDAIDDLKGRVQALETQVNALNGNIEALGKLYQGSEISSVKNENGKCTITLTNGDVLTLVSDIDALVPVVSIDASGNWQYTIGDGEPVSLGVKAEAEDGKTPTFQVSDAGIWQIDLGDGQGWRDVTYANGQPVSAITDTPTEDKFFQTVEVVGDSLHIVMKGGEELNVPIVKDFLCQIVTESEGVQLFDVGVTREFTVNMRGVETTLVTAPEGWTAELTEPVDGADGMKTALLRVTSPSAGGTRATASTSKDVSILATSGKYACLAKIQVESTGVDPNAPRITVANSTTVVPTHSTLTFDVVLTNATTWKYICQPTGDTAPTAETILSEGTKGSGTSVTVSDLSGDTAYTIYVVAYEGAKVSEVASVENRTEVAPIDYYETGYTIDGVTYDKNTPDVQLITETSEIAAKGVYFLDPKDESVVITLSGKDGAGYGDLVIIGRYSDSKPTVTFTTYVSIKGPGSGLVFKNVQLDGTGVDNYMFNLNGTGAIDRFVVEDCKIETTNDKALGYFSTAGSIGKFILKSNKIHMNVSGTGKTGVHGLNFGANFKVANTTDITIQNNVFYADYPTTGGLINGNAGATYSQTMNVEVLNNTFVNYLGVNAYVVINDGQTVDIKKNLIWSSKFGGTAYFFRLNANLKHVILNLEDNCIYNDGTTGSWMYISGNNMPANYESSPELKKAESDPFAGGTFDLEHGIFIPGSSYAGYGSDLQ